MLCRVTAVSRFAALVVVLVCIGQATASLHLQVHHSGRQGNTSAANTTTGCLTYSNETACASNAACAWNPSTGVCTNSSSGNNTNGNSTNCVNGTSLNSTNCNSTNGNSTTNGTDCIFHETEAGCLSNASCVWNPATGICYTNTNSSSGNSTTNGTDCTFLYTDESSCDANASCIWDPAEAVCLTKNSTTNGTDCSNHMTAAGCLSNASCVWDPVTVTCYTNTNSSSGNSTNGNSTNCVNGTSLNSTNCNSTNGNNTNGNSTMKAGRSSVRGVNRHCQAARTAKHCVAKAACYWDAIGLSCREAVVGAHAVASDRTTSHLGSTSARSAGGAHGRDIAAPVVGGVLAVASVVGVALLRLRRNKKSVSTGGASDAAERVPIVRVCDDNTANE